MTDLTFDGKVAIITGAGGGLGRSHALELARRGARIVVNDLGGSVDGTGDNASRPSWWSTRSLPPAARQWPTTTRLPLRRAAAAIVQSAVDAFGTVDIADQQRRHPARQDVPQHDARPDQARHRRAPLGAFYVTQPAWLIMREKNYGRIVNTSSNSGLLGNFGQANYGAAKLGLVGFTRVLANEGRKRNIKVNAIAPVARTRMTEDLLGPLGDKLEPSEVTPTVVLPGPRGRARSAARCTRRPAAWSPATSSASPRAGTRKTTPPRSPRQLRPIRDEDGYIVPDDPSGELGKLLKLLSS